MKTPFDNPLETLFVLVCCAAGYFCLMYFFRARIK